MATWEDRVMKMIREAANDASSGNALRSGYRDTTGERTSGFEPSDALQHGKAWGGRGTIDPGEAMFFLDESKRVVQCEECDELNGHKEGCPNA